MRTKSYIFMDLRRGTQRGRQWRSMLTYGWRWRTKKTLYHPQHSEYRRMVEELLYLSVGTRTEMAIAVSTLAKIVHAFTVLHREMVRRVLRHLSGTRSLTIVYPSHPTSRGLEAYCRADWEFCAETRQSTTGIVVTANGAQIIWKSSWQSIVAPL